ncbi:testin-like isoform X2 [Mya arenaria]|uniref:testin-like isoform X2 n=1 Tax=Mya arenaria TaxID=6604 RepID=UPI0022E04760|nr:testin-like isoform X2 [Mya arenaria]
MDASEHSCSEGVAGSFGERPRCLKCGDRCPGLDMHYWRKICKHCRCGPEDHDLTDEDDRQLSRKPRDPRELSTRIHKLNIDDPAVQSEIVTPENDLVIHRIVSENLRSQQYVSMLPKDKQLFAAQLRRRQLQRQLPLHDLHARFCDSLTEKEGHKFQKFAEKRRNKAAGIGTVGAVPEKPPTRCHRCDLTIDPKSFAMLTSRLGGTACFHTGCFTCATCRELLVDNIYFCRGGDIYCGRHYAELIYPRCSACDEIIFSREYTQAENQSWHVQHFCCWYCDTPLAGLRYIAQQNNPYCVQCFDRLYSKVCATCGRTITADSPGLSHGPNHWHACPHCFCCHCCHTSLINRQFLLKDGRLFCSTSCRHVYDTAPRNAFPRPPLHQH